MLDVSLGDALRRYCAERPLEPAFRRAGDGQAWTRRELLSAASNAAAALCEFSPGDRVLLLLENDFPFLAWFWGCQLAGLVAVPLEPLRDGDRLDMQLGKIAAIIERTGAAAAVMKAGGRSSHGTCLDRLRTIPADLATASSAVPAARRGADDLALIQFTSGTTGYPKGCALRHRNLIANAHAALTVFGAADGDGLFNWMPFHHDMGLMAGVVAPVIGRMYGYVDSPRGFILNPAGWLRKISSLKPTHLTMSNFGLSLVLRACRRSRLPEADLASVRAIICGAEPIDPALVRSFLETLAPLGLRQDAFVACYGLAEATVLATARSGGLLTLKADQDGLNRDNGLRLSAAPDARELVSVGRPVPGVEVRVVENDRPLPEDMVGEILLSSEGTMEGYFGDREATNAALDGRWLRTGDNGLIHGGELYLVGRRKDILIVCGQNIDPIDLETRAAIAAGLVPRRLCAVEVAGAEGQNGLILAVQGVRPTPAISIRLKKACFDAVGIQPQIVHFEGRKFPRTSSGKIQRSRVAALCRELSAIATD